MTYCALLTCLLVSRCCCETVMEGASVGVPVAGMCRGIGGMSRRGVSLMYAASLSGTRMALPALVSTIYHVESARTTAAPFSSRMTKQRDAERPPSSYAHVPTVILQLQSARKQAPMQDALGQVSQNHGRYARNETTSSPGGSSWLLREITFRSYCIRYSEHGFQAYT